MNTKIRNVAIVVLILYIIASLYFLLTPVSVSLKKDLLSIPTDKILHFLMFAPYPLFFWIIFRYGKDNYVKRPINYIVIFLISISIGAVTEVSQTLLTVNRSGDIKDFFADVLGVTFTLIMLWIFEKPKKSKI